MAKLARCKHCGGDAELTIETLDERVAYANRATIRCLDCRVGVSRMGDTSQGGYADNSTVEAEAIAAWNRRVALKEQGDE